MTQDRYADRVQPDRYADDPLVGLFTNDPVNADCAWVPERVWRRIHLLGVAYELHYLSLSRGDTDPLVWDVTQARALLDELEFVRGIVNDPLLADHLHTVGGVVAAATRGGQDSALRIEGQ